MLPCEAEILVPPYIDLGGPQQLVNISTRSHVGPEGDVVIVGFVVHENLPKRYLIRAVGPSLAGFGSPMRSRIRSWRSTSQLRRATS